MEQESETPGAEHHDQEEVDDRVLIIYSGEIRERGVSRLISAFLNSAKPGPRRQASLILTTNGGDVHQAYRLITALRAFYEGIDVVVVTRCKSAGTLIAIGADTLAVSVFGELGPLDVQLAKPDEIAQESSGLDTLESLDVVYKEAFEAFEHYMLGLISKSYTTISTTTACNIASDLVSGIFRPIAAQVDPYKLAEVRRSMAIAEAYGRRLEGTSHNLKDVGSLSMLIKGYPAHEFVINVHEARTLFERVRDPSDEEIKAFGHCVEIGKADPGANPPYVEILDTQEESDDNEATEQSGDIDGHQHPSTADSERSEDDGSDTESDRSGGSEGR